MKIVVDIDDNLYTRLFDNGVDNYDDADIENMAKAIRKGTPLPEQEPCEDAVSREAVMNVLGDSINDDKDYNRAVVLLNNLPSVTPQKSEEV